MMKPSDTPAWPTKLRSRLRDGRLMGTDNSVWVYKAVPMSPIADARSADERLSAAIPIFAAINELAAATPVQVRRRAMAKGNYRQIHMLLVNVPRLYRPQRDQIVEPYLRQQFARTVTTSRVLLFGVQLKSKVGGDGTLRSAIDSVTETLVHGGTPLADYDEDAQRVEAMLGRSGLVDATPDQISLANAWWNHGDNPDTPVLLHADHVHVFGDSDSIDLARASGLDSCADWNPKGPRPIPGQHAITMASVDHFDLNFVKPDARAALWVNDMVESGALAVSVRAQVEPGKVTRDELRRQKKRFIDDINERQQQGKMDRSEQREMLEALSDVESRYASDGDSTPTLAGASAVVAFSGSVRDISQIAQNSVASLSLMMFRQQGALEETMLCSSTRANPNLHDLPAQVAACSGAPSLSFVGDTDGALLGFTERDRQPAFMSSSAASTADGLPIALVAGATGSGKTQVALHLAYQWAQANTPTIFIDPKALALDTPIPTPGGWTTMAEIAVGDQVFGRDGKPCNVTHKSRVFTTDETRLYEIVLDDGQAVRADQNHLWVVLDQKARTAMRRDGADGSETYLREVLTEDLLLEGLKRGGQTNFAIPVAAPVQHTRADLPIDPYVFGAWLGDGTSKAGVITVGDDDRDEMQSLLSEGWPTTKVVRPLNRAASIVLGRNQEVCLYGHDDYVEVNHGDRPTRRCATCEREHQSAYQRGERRAPGAMTNPSFVHLLRDLDVYRDKRIPAVYATSSIEQRTALLQGLMDTDGTVKTRGDLRITMTNEHLMRDVLTLVRSLGYKASWWEGEARISQTGTVRTVGRQYVVTFSATSADPIFRLSRKKQAQQERCPSARRPRSRLLYVKDVRPVESAEAQCIRVDSPDHTYLVAGFVPTHNTGSDHSPIVEAAGGQVASLDQLTSADGIFDPIRFAASKEVGVELAASMLMAINPWGRAQADFEVPLQYALAHGVGRGARCVMEALNIAEEELQGIPAGMIQSVRQLTESSAMFRAIAGVNPTTDGLRVANGITYIKVGNSHLDLPEPGASNPTLSQRTALALVRMMVFGSAMALTGRGGAVMLDEAWVFLGAGRSEVERLGRLARSQQVLPMLFTQRVTDAVNAGLAGYISRGLILPIADRDEAAAACELFKLEPTGARLDRITAKATRGGNSQQATRPNWASMRALRDPNTNQVLRGAVGIYADLDGRAIPIEVTLPREFLDLASTNPQDIRRRDEAIAARRAAAAQATTDEGSGAGGDLVAALF